MLEGEQPTVYHPEPQSNVGKWSLMALAVVYVGGSLFFIYSLHGKLEKVTHDQTTAKNKLAI